MKGVKNWFIQYWNTLQYKNVNDTQYTVLRNYFIIIIQLYLKLNTKQFMEKDLKHNHQKIASKITNSTCIIKNRQYIK